MSDSVTVIGLDSRSVLTTIKVADSPSRIAVDELAGVAYVTCLGADRVDVIDLQTLRVLHHIHTADRPSGIAVDPVSGHLYVTSYNDKVVQIFRG